MEIKDIIRNKRLEKGWTMKELAEKVGVSEATISRWESGEIENMKHKGIVSLSNILGIEPNIIMGWEEYKEPTLPDFFTSPQEAVDFLLKQNVIMGYNGLDITKLSEEEQVEYANEILNQIKLVSYKYKD